MFTGVWGSPLQWWDMKASSFGVTRGQHLYCFHEHGANKHTTWQLSPSHVGKGSHAVSHACVTPSLHIHLSVSSSSVERGQDKDGSQWPVGEMSSAGVTKRRLTTINTLWIHSRPLETSGVEPKARKGGGERDCRYIGESFGIVQLSL